MSLFTAALAFGLISVPVLGLCAVLDRRLRGSAALPRRRIWLAGIAVTIVLFSAWQFLPHRQPGLAFWDDAEPAETRTLAVAIAGAIQTLGDIPAATASAGDAPGGLRAIGAGIHGLVTGWLLLRWLLALLRVRHHLRHATAVDDRTIATRCRQLAGRIGLNRPFRLLWSTRQRSPAAFGALRGGVLLPDSAGNWPPSRRDRVLLHELAHLRHHDHAILNLVYILCVFQWFNPLFWLALRRLRDLSEMAADELAVQATGDSGGYAMTLVTMARDLRRRPALTGMADHALGRRIDHLLRLRTVPPRKSGLSLTAVVLAGIGVGASAALLDEPQLVGWQAQQIRWESATRANGLFLHGEVTLEPGRLGLGREGLLLALAEDGGELHTCVAWRNDVRARRFECDRPGAPQQHLDALLGEAAPLWPDDPGSPLSAYWQPDPAAATRYAGSHIIGIPGRSRNPDREILQAGWITSDGARIGVFRRADAFATAFRYRPDTRGLLLIRTIGGGAPAAWSNGSWRSASRQESNWFHATLEQLDADNSARSD